MGLVLIGWSVPKVNGLYLDNIPKYSNKTKKRKG